MMSYKVLTNQSVLDIQANYITDEENQKALIALWEEQNALINGEYFAIHFIEDKHFNDELYELSNDMDDTIQCLAIKDGVDIVKFDNGNLGFVAYYNGHENCFEFKTLSKEQYDELSWEENEEDIKELFN